MANILVACHCKTRFKSRNDPNSTMHRTPGYKEKDKDMIPIPDDVEYIDINPECPSNEKQYKQWSDVPKNSKDFIYTINCSLYRLLLNFEKRLAEEHSLILNLLNDGWDILRPGGKIIIPVDDNITINYLKDSEETKIGNDALDHQLNNLKIAIELLSPHGWKAEIKTSDQLTFILLPNDEGTYKKDNFFLVITKHYDGGKRKNKNKSRKVKSRKIKSRKSKKNK